MKIGFKKLSKTELKRLRGGGRSACCTHTTANSDCTKMYLTCSSGSTAVKVIDGKYFDKNGKAVKLPARKEPKKS